MKETILNCVLTKQLLNVFKPWCEWGISLLRSTRGYKGYFVKHHEVKNARHTQHYRTKNKLSSDHGGIKGAVSWEIS